MTIEQSYFDDFLLNYSPKISLNEMIGKILNFINSNYTNTVSRYTTRLVPLLKFAILFKKVAMIYMVLTLAPKYQLE